jgi:hypothetical protein
MNEFLFKIEYEPPFRGEGGHKQKKVNTLGGRRQEQKKKNALGGRRQMDLCSYRC